MDTDENAVIQRPLSELERRVMRRFYRRVYKGQRDDPNPFFNKVLTKLLKREQYLKDLQVIRMFYDGNIDETMLKNLLKVLKPDVDKPFVDQNHNTNGRRVIKHKSPDKVVIGTRANWWGADLYQLPVWRIWTMLSRAQTLSKTKCKIWTSDAKTRHAIEENGRIEFVEPKQAPRTVLPNFDPMVAKGDGVEAAGQLAAYAHSQLDELDQLYARLRELKGRKPPRREHTRRKLEREIAAVELAIKVIELREKKANRTHSGVGTVKHLPESEQSRRLRKRLDPYKPKRPKKYHGPE